MTNLQEKNIGIAGLFPEDSWEQKAILDLVEENKMSQQVKEYIPEIQKLIGLADVLEDMVTAFDMIEEHYEEAE